MNPLDIARIVISAIIVFGFGGVLIAWMIWQPTTNSTILAALTTALGTGYLNVIYYWFNKSQSS